MSCISQNQKSQISKKQDERNIYAIIKTMCPPSYQHNGFVATHALGHMIHVHYAQPYITCPSASVATKPLW